MSRFYLFVGMCLISSPALGCSCTKPIMTLEEEIRRAFSSALTIVQAQAIAVKDEVVPAPKEAPPLLQKQRVTWQITRTWKGSYEPRSTIESVTDGFYGACGVAVKKGDVYVLYLHGSLPFFLSICSESKPLKDAAQEIVILDALSSGAGA